MNRRRPIPYGRFGSWGSSARPGSLTLDGSAGYFSVASNAIMTPSSDKMGLAVRVKIGSRPSNGSYAGIISKADYGVSSSWGIRLGFDTYGDVLSASMSASGTEIYGNASESRGGRYSYPTGCWVWLVWNYDSAASGTAKSTLYVNSNPIEKTGYRGTHPADILTSTAAMLIGAIRASGSLGSFLGAEVSDVYLYDAVLTEANQRSLMTGSPPAGYVMHFALSTGSSDDGPSALTGTLGGGATLTGNIPTSYSSVVRWHPIGDSLTRGQEPDWSGTYRGGYRRLVAEALAALGIGVRGVGSQSSNEGWVNDHDGVNASLISDTFTRCTNSASYTPDVVSYMAGTNNSRSGTTAAVAIADYSTAMANIYTGQSPYCILIPPPKYLLAETRYNQEMILGMNSYVKNILAPAQVALGRSVYCPDIAYDITDVCSDHVHLNNQGYQRIADAVGYAIANRPANGTAPAVTHRAAFRAAATVKLLLSGRYQPTMTSGKISSMLDLHVDDSGTSSHTASQATAASRFLWNGCGMEARAGQDDFTGDWMTLSGGAILGTNAFTAGALVRWYSDPTLDLNFGHVIGAFEGPSGRWVVMWVRETADGSGVYKLWIVANQGGANTPMYSVPWTHQTTSVRRIVVQGDGSSAPTVYVDGVSKTVTSEGTATIGYDSSSIGAVIVSSTAYFPIDAALREIVLCDGNDASTLSAVNTYLDTAL